MGISQSQDKSLDRNILDDQSQNVHKELLANPKTEILPIEDNLKHFQKCLVDGLDRRESVDANHLKSFPYSAVLVLEIRLKNHFFHGTAALIDAVHALTVAHNVCENDGTWASSIRVISATKDSHTFVSQVFKFKSCDLALLVFCQPLSENKKYFKMRYLGKDSRVNNIEARITGLDGDGNKIFNSKECYPIRTHKGRLEYKKEKQALSYDIDTSKGQSGSPVWTIINNEYFIIGIHSNAETTVNQGVPLLPGHIEQINKCIKGYTDESLKNNLLEKDLNTKGANTEWKMYFFFNDRTEVLEISRLEKNNSRATDKNFIQLLDYIVEKNRIPQNNGWNTLKINLDSCSQMTAEGVKSLIARFNSSLRGIKTLEINFSRCGKITDQQISDLMVQIREDIPRLERLSLDFKGCLRISDEGLNNITNEINTTSFKLKAFSINLSRCEKITDKGFTFLISKIAESQTDLEYLNLGFSECGKVTDESIKKLAEQLKTDFVNLKDLRLDLWRCWQISDDGVNSLAAQIERRRNLRYLKLDLSRTLQEDVS